MDAVVIANPGKCVASWWLWCRRNKVLKLLDGICSIYAATAKGDGCLVSTRIVESKAEDCVQGLV